MRASTLPHQIFGSFGVTGKPARKIVSGAEARQHDILKTGERSQLFFGCATFL
jgi:hypothetical protein